MEPWGSFFLGLVVGFVGTLAILGIRTWGNE